MQYYPVYLDLRGRSCVVIGGGTVATRKVESLLEAGARVTVVSPALTEPLAALAETHEIVHHARPYRTGDLTGAALVFAATDDEDVHATIASDAAAAGVLLNVVDRPPLCGFIVPAVVRRGPITIGISTGGASPALARRMRRELEGSIGPEYELAATILARLRPVVHAARSDAEARARIFAGLVDGPLLDALRARDAVAVDRILAGAVGDGTTLAALGVRV